MPYDSLLIYAYGGPESMAEVPDFIRNVTGGRVSAERLAEVQAHYAHFGGVSPMNGAIREFMRLWRAEHPEIPTGELEIRGAVYEIETGEVRWIEE